MPKRKGKFSTFLFSLIPGFGQMYLGFMKQGLSIFSALCAVFILTDWLRLSAPMYLVPLIWFYGFFDAMNKNSMSDEEFYSIEDDYLFHFSSLPDAIKKLCHSKAKIIAAVICLYLGASLLYNNLSYFLHRWFGWNFLNGLDAYIRRLPQLALAVAIILFGLYLISGKKKELDEEYEESPSQHSSKASGSGNPGAAYHKEPDAGQQPEDFYPVNSAPVTLDKKKEESSHENA